MGNVGSVKGALCHFGEEIKTWEFDIDNKDEVTITEQTSCSQRKVRSVNTA